MIKYITHITILLSVFACQNKYIYDLDKNENVSKHTVTLPIIPFKMQTLDTSNISIGKGSYNAVYFAYNSFRIDAVYKSNLKIISDFLSQNKNYTLNIHGHTDSKGSTVYNQKLSTKRAKEVKKYFTSLGIEAYRLNISGFAYSKPQKPGKSSRDESYNRRVEVHFIKN